MKDLVNASPVCLPYETIEIIEKLGKNFHQATDKVTQVRNLAGGFSDIVIMEVTANSK
jgi:hypothetical protein